jgi:hypothetical protein
LDLLVSSCTWPAAFSLIDAFRSEKELVLRQCLGAADEAVRLRFLEDLPQWLALGPVLKLLCLALIGFVGRS